MSGTLTIRSAQVPAVVPNSRAQVRTNVLELAANRERTGKWGWLLVALFLTLTLIATSFVQIGGVINIAGQVRAGGEPIQIRPETGGRLQTVMVRNGDEIVAGQVLLQLDASDLLTLQAGLDARLERLQVQAARLEALIDGGVIDVAADPLILAESERLLRAERAQIAEDRALAQARLTGATRQMTGLDNRIDAQRRQLAVTREELAGLRSLLERGLTAQARVRGLERLVESLLAEIAASESERAALASMLVEIEQDQVSRQRTLEAEWLAQLQMINGEIATIKVERQRADLAAGKAQILAPISGIVVDAIVREPGTVVSSGETLMSIVASDAKPVIQATLPSSDIEAVHEGQSVQIDLSPLDPLNGNRIDGFIIRVAADTSVNANGIAGFEIEVSPDHAEAQLPVGAPVQIMVPTSQESLMARLLAPLSNRLGDALAER